MSYEADILAGRVVKGMTFNEKVWAVCACPGVR